MTCSAAAVCLGPLVGDWLSAEAKVNPAEGGIVVVVEEVTYLMISNANLISEISNMLIMAKYESHIKYFT